MSTPGGGRAAGPAAARAVLWDALRRGDEQAARGIALAALEDGMPAEDVLLDLVAAVQRTVGAEWAANRMTVAQEHAATAINDHVVSAVAAHPAAAGTAGRGRIAVACIDGEWHALPARLLAEVLRLRGWHVDYLGSQVPVPHLVEHLHHTGPDAVALSSSLPVRLPTAHLTVTACQAAGVPVLAGGAAFGADGRFARLLGADAWAPDARTAADLLAQGPPRPRPPGAHPPVDDLPAAARREYVRLVPDSPRLVREALDGLQERFPAVRDHGDRRLQQTAEDLARTVEFLAAAVYTDDGAVFTGFAEWLADVLAARGAPAGFVPAALDLLGARLTGLPRAAALLRAARGALGARRTAPGRPA
ncbi:cobalamin-binding protein [Streptomyces sulfonofaciens]|uniref:Cobalamin-binding protein n=1 Tax=Streptomyces sulfonofaciens TaxID=68272 RepID=A0A919FY84_9ACTN|nr:cobalamin-dependent protein [Streptomyces sulfonofaciens]GHH74717.1 cobalamin-binding protein [Streptomyces sulfonofaciens]